MPVKRQNPHRQVQAVLDRLLDSGTKFRLKVVATPRIALRKFDIVCGEHINIENSTLTRFTEKNTDHFVMLVSFLHVKCRNVKTFASDTVSMIVNFDI